MDYKEIECNLKLAIKSNCKCIDQKLSKSPVYAGDFSFFKIFDL
ncbi:hypothetical protein HOLDEFILI_00819 [Holdemania filiformis DSM 12042]|uniref:Uncharacterized protein n=1 Tax=Holdemania filiformis DSM 12042 TaxID=545696 RepID=B9Y4T8_9FIRM|nr:hypothetical protein HOLDEFILI_00819 [Holdemania filiformis DSM 12042]